MLALIYLGLAIALGDLVCRRFYRFVSLSHRCAAATLVGVLLSAWFTHTAGMVFARSAEPLLFADILFFVVVSGAIFWLSRKAPRVSTIAPRAPGASAWDWITLGALFAAVCILMIGTLYINKQSRLCLSGTQTSDFALQLTIAQEIALGHNLPTELAHSASQVSRDQFLFFYQTGNLEFLGLNLAWSVDVLSVLGLTSMLALVMVLGELLFNSRVVGRLGATLFFFCSSLRHSANFLPSEMPARGEAWRFWKQIALVNQRHLPFAIGIFILVLIFLVDWYRQRGSRRGSSSDANLALRESTERHSGDEVRAGFASRFIMSARPALAHAKSFVFSGLLLAAVPLRNTSHFIATTVALCCLFVAYGSWSSSKGKAAAMLIRVLAGISAICILAAGVVDLFGLYGSSRIEVKPENEPLVKGLVFRNSLIYKIPDSLPLGLARGGLLELPVTAFEGGQGSGRGQFDNPHGLAVDSAGNILVADTNNGRVQKFSPNGTFVRQIGPFEAPSGIAIDRAGNIYVAEIGSKHCVQKVGPNGTFIAAWAPALYGPRKIAIGPDDTIYVVDSGRNRIVKFSPDGHVVASWGGVGSGNGQFRGNTSVAVDSANNKVYVADPMNSRIQIFDSAGNFITKWSVPEWGQPVGFEDLAIDLQTGRLYASSAHMNSILVFDLQGNRIGALTPKPPDKLESPSALALTKDKLLVLNTASPRVCVIDLQTR